MPLEQPPAGASGQDSFRSKWIEMPLRLFVLTRFLHANRCPLRLKTL